MGAAVSLADACRALCSCSAPQAVALDTLQVPSCAVVMHACITTYAYAGLVSVTGPSKFLSCP